MRLIDADRLKDSIMFTCDLGGWIGDTLLQIKKLAVKYIENAPTIDAVEVVRCKDCKHRYGDECPMRYVEWVTYDDDGYIEWDDIVHDHTMDDGYCSFGEREDGEP